jgi:mono/diheme cytochrome c family protein
LRSLPRPARRNISSREDIAENTVRLSRLALILILIIAAQNAWLLYPRLKALVLRTHEDPAIRGRVLAARLGCFSCHGPDGVGGVPNPGSRWQTVPGFGEQTLMMYAHSDEEIREYVLDGAPSAKQLDDDYREAMQGQALQMPAYRGFISDAELDDLVAYIRAASGMFTPPEGSPASRGAQVARDHGCLYCHGEMGLGGRPNPGSLKGYVPGFVGEDFADLVRSDDELHGWITEGTIERLQTNRLARYFIERQRLRMPAFRAFLSDEQVDDLGAYVRWLSRQTWRSQPLPH